ncbi:MAG: hypothetical protein ACK5DE_09980 [Bacteroidota bacterium]|jgi:hypothetical protein
MANITDFCRAIVLNGGATYDLNTGRLDFKTGYAVGLYGTTYLKEHPVKECVMQFIKMYLDDALDGAIGAWIKDDLLYLDVVKIVEDKDEAFQLAIEHQQKCIYSFLFKKDIYVKDYTHSRQESSQ